MNINVRRYGLLVLVIVAIVAARSFVGWLQQDKGDKTFAEVEKIIQSSPAAEMYAALQKYFPGEAKFFVTRAQELANSGVEKSERHAKSLQIGIEIRRRNAPYLRSASNGSLKQILNYQTNMFREFQDEPETCNAMLMLGPEGLSPEDRKRLVKFTSNSAALFKAMFEGKNEPIERQASNEADWTKLITAFNSNGGSDAEFNLVVEPDQSNPEMCSAFINFFGFLENASFAGSDRILAEVVMGMNES